MFARCLYKVVITSEEEASWYVPDLFVSSTGFPSTLLILLGRVPSSNLMLGFTVFLRSIWLAGLYDNESLLVSLLSAFISAICSSTFSADRVNLNCFK